MFNFFANLALTIYLGVWPSVQNGTIVQGFIEYFSGIPIFGMFNNSTEAFYSSSGDYVVQVSGNAYRIPALANFISVILATICCIGVFWLIVNSIRKLFSVFLEWF